MQNQIKAPTPLLHPDGTLAAKGYATKMHIGYNRECAKANPINLKEWNFYQIQKDHLILQMTLGHVSYMCSISATLIDLDTGKRYEFGTMKPLFIPKLDTDPEKESTVSYSSENYRLNFQVTPVKRILHVEGSSKRYRNVCIHIELDNDIENEKMVIATPFDKPHQFYLNYKENYYSGTGYAEFDDEKFDFDDCTGLLDWGRGIWPYIHEWYWGSLTDTIDAVPFGFNIGWGFGNLSHATENMFFYNKKAYKLGKLQVERDERDYMKPWYFRDPEGKLEMTMTPIFDNYTQNKYVVIDTHCNQIFGHFSGWVRTEEGIKEFHNLLAFTEHAVNRW